MVVSPSSVSSDELLHCSDPARGGTQQARFRVTHTTRNTEHGKTRSCKVVGCSADLQILGKAYCLKKNICPDHLKADAVRCNGMGNELWRFCQQCGKLEPLKRFEGAKRSCRASLHKRRLLSSDKQQKGNKRQQQHLAMMRAAMAGGGSYGCDSSCFRGSSDACCNDTAEAATAALAAAWCDYQQEQNVTCTDHQLSRSSSAISSGTWPAAASTAADVGTAEVACDVWAAAEAGNAYSSSMPAVPAAAAALPPPGGSCLLSSPTCFLSSPNCCTSTSSSGTDGCEAALLEWMLEIEGELLAATILAANNNSADTQQPGGQADVPGAVFELLRPALNQQQQLTAAAANHACIRLLAPPPLCTAGAPQYTWGPAGVAASQQLPNSCAVPAMPNATGMTHLLGPGQYGNGFSGTAVPGAAGSSVLHAAGPHGVERYNVINTKLQALTARFGQLQIFMDHLQQLHAEEAALRAQLAGVSAAAASSEATDSYVGAGWQQGM